MAVAIVVLGSSSKKNQSVLKAVDDTASHVYKHTKMKLMILLLQVFGISWFIRTMERDLII